MIYQVVVTDKFTGPSTLFTFMLPSSSAIAQGITEYCLVMTWEMGADSRAFQTLDVLVPSPRFSKPFPQSFEMTAYLKLAQLWLVA